MVYLFMLMLLELLITTIPYQCQHDLDMLGNWFG